MLFLFCKLVSYKKIFELFLIFKFKDLNSELTNKIKLIEHDKEMAKTKIDQLNNVN